MSRSQNKPVFTKLIDYFMPGNCRLALETAFKQNVAASTSLINYIHKHEHQIVAALKHDRRTKAFRKLEL